MYNITANVNATGIVNINAPIDIDFRHTYIHIKTKYNINIIYI